jgi:hypothetical protein
MRISTVLLVFQPFHSDLVDHDPEQLRVSIIWKTIELFCALDLLVKNKPASKMSRYYTFKLITLSSSSRTC